MRIKGLENKIDDARRRLALLSAGLLKDGGLLSEKTFLIHFNYMNRALRELMGEALAQSRFPDKLMTVGSPLFMPLLRAQHGCRKEFMRGWVPYDPEMRLVNRSLPYLPPPPQIEERGRG